MDDPNHPRVLISDRQELPVDEAALADLAARCLLAEGRGRSELSVSFVSEDEMSKLHARFMGEGGSTDVLSFPLDGEDDGREVLGDVVVCPAFAARQGDDLGSELRLLLVHGILHLLGHDHEEEEGRREMWARQEAYTGVRVP
jgi:probable rRNA maturation factor